MRAALGLVVLATIDHVVALTPLGIFNPNLQRIDVSGDHEFIPPGPEDLRGPCPAMNALANHNFIPHNGVTTATQAADAIYSVYGMGKDLATLLSVYASLTSGNLESFSIGGPTQLVTTFKGLGQPQGISYSHNKFEVDTSATRGDIYVYGQTPDLQMPFFKTLYELQQGSDANYNLNVINKFHAFRLEQCKHENPYLFLGPLPVFVSNAAYLFITRILFSNNSLEYPEGVLNKQTLKSFHAINGTDKNLRYTPGYERILENWYKRPVGGEYNLIGLVIDIVAKVLTHPELFTLGGNTGAVDTFAGVDVEDLTGGIYNAGNLFEGNNPACFALQALEQVTPDIFEDILDFPYELSAMKKLIGGMTSELSCPQLRYYNTSAFSRFPGYAKLKRRELDEQAE